MLLWENKRAKLLSVIKMGINPFKKFVSTGEIKEELKLAKSRKELVSTIINAIERNENCIIPIIGNVGVGKTHLYWELKENLYYFNTIYVSLEHVYKKFFYNTYSEFIEEIGTQPLRSIANQLCNNWGALEKIYGFFHVADIEKVRKVAFEKLSGKFEDKIALIDAIQAIVSHQLDPYKKIEAERWLLGELMDIRELSRLNLMHDLRKKSNAFTMLKILIENLKLGSVLFIDDFEKILSKVKPGEESEESEEIFDPSWLYGTETSPENVSTQKTFNKILRLQKIRGLRIIITLNTVDSLEEIKKMVKEIEPKLLLTIKKPLFLLNFSEEDIFEFYKKSIKNFARSIDYSEYFEEFQDSYFPVNEEVLKFVFKKTNGNPREIVKFLIKIFNEIIFSGLKLSEILDNYQF